MRRSRMVFAVIMLSALSPLIVSCTAPVLSQTDPTPTATIVRERGPYALGAGPLYLYPEGTSDLNYNPFTLKGENLVYKWVCTAGKITGNGPTATWKAPNEYGVFHIMLTVTDGSGASETATVDLNVIPPPQPDCPYCRQN